MQIDFDKSENSSEVYLCNVHILIKWNDEDWILTIQTTVVSRSIRLLQKLSIF